MKEQGIKESQKYSFRKGDGKTDLPGVSLFNSNEFVLSRKYTGSIIQYFLYKDDTPIGKMNIMVEEGDAASFVRSTFGSIETSEPVDEKVLRNFVSNIKTDLKIKNVHSFYITNYPDAFNLAFTDLESIYRTEGFKTEFADINQFLEIDSQSFYEKAKKGRKHFKLKKSHMKGYETKLVGVDELKEAYEHIRNSRLAKNFSLSMTYNELLEMFKLFPDRYFLFVTRDKDIIISVAVCIAVNDRIFYTFYTSGSEEYKHDSPTVFTLEYVYNYARDHGYTLLDLGRSAIDEDLNKGVYHFKKSLGAGECYKRQFYIEL